MTHSLVVGGTRGAGRALVSLFLRQGHTVSVIARHPPSHDAGLDRVHFWRADLLNSKRLPGLLKTIVRQNGKVHNLVFYQRYRGGGDDWAGELGATLTATKTIIEILSDQFETSRGASIVMVSSLASQFAALEQPVSYHVGKAGLQGFISYYAVALGPRGIRINAISPGTLLKEESKSFYLSHPRLMALYRKIIPLGRMGTPDDIAQVADFLCSPRASFLTGQNIVVDGGLSRVLQDTLARQLTSQPFKNSSLRRSRR